MATEIRSEKELREELAKVDAELARLEIAINGMRAARAALLFALGEAPLFMEQRTQEPTQ